MLISPWQWVARTVCKVCRSISFVSVNSQWARASSPHPHRIESGLFLPGNIIFAAQT
jgi:hypothetical protein